VRTLISLVLLTLALAACSAATIATVNDTDISTGRLADLHVDVNELDEDEIAASVLLLLLHEAFITSADEGLGLEPDRSAVEMAYAARTVRWADDEAIELGLAARNERPARLTLEAELDTIRDQIAEHLVRTESAGFDLDVAYHDYLIDNALVCIQHVQFDDPANYDVAKARLDDGEDFADVALDMSFDPFVSRQDGGTGAGGDIGCSAPFALPVGMMDAALEAPVGEPFGPVFSTLGSHLIWVTSRAVPELETAKPDVLDHAVDKQGPELFRLWAVETLQAIKVTIAEEYGTWGILPETDPVPTVVPPSRIELILPG